MPAVHFPKTFISNRNFRKTSFTFSFINFDKVLHNLKLKLYHRTLFSFLFLTFIFLILILYLL